MKNHTTTHFLLYLGRIVPLVFVCTLVWCGLQMGNYNHLTRLVSELGALGTTTQFLFNGALVLCALLSLLFVFGLIRACKEMNISSLPVVIILSFTISIFGAGIFPLPLRMHGIAGRPSILLPLSPLFSLFLWRKAQTLRGLVPFSLLSLILMSLGFLVFFPGVWDSYPGLIQRIFHSGWVVWFSYLSYQFVSSLSRNSVSR